MVDSQAKLPWLISSVHHDDVEIVVIEDRIGRQILGMNPAFEMYEQLEIAGYIVMLANQRLRDLDDGA